MCFDTAWTETSYGSASSLTVASPDREAGHHVPPRRIGEGGEDPGQLVVGPWTFLVQLNG